MTVQLPVSGNLITIAATTFPNTVFQTVLTGLGISVAITGSQSTDAAGNVTVSGTASLLGASGAQVSGSFAFAANGTLAAGTLRIALPASWTVAAGFPGLPQTDYGQPVPTPTGAALVITTAAGTDAATGAALQPGLNLVGQAGSGFVGLLASFLDGGKPVPVSALITFPAVNAPALPPLPEGAAPWSATPQPPGLLMIAALPMGKGGIGGGQLALQSLDLMLYVPPSNAWMVANPSYGPLTAAQGKLAIPSAGITAAITVEGMLGGASDILIQGQFTGLSLGDLGHLADLAGSSSLTSALPADAQSGGALASLSLESLALYLGTDLSVQQVTLAIGMPQLSTKVVPGFTITSALAAFTIQSPFSSPSVGVVLQASATIGAVAVQVTLDLPNQTASFELPAGATLPLGELETLLGLPASPASFTLSSLDLEVTLGSSGGFTIQAQTAAAPGWTIPLGPTSLTIENVQVAAAKQAGGPVGLSLQGQLTLAGATMDVSYASPGALSISAQLPTINLSALVAALDKCGLQLPSGFDASLTNGSLLITEANGAYQLTAMATVAGVGVVALTCQGQGSTSGVAIGIALAAQPSAVAGLSGLSSLEAAIGLQDFVLVASSLQNPGFQFPALSVFNNSSLTGGVQLPASVSGLTKGLNIYAQLAACPSQGLGRLLSWAGVPLNGSIAVTTAISLPDPATASKLFVSAAGTVGHSTLNAEIGLLMASGEPGAFLQGTLATTVGGNQSVTFDVTADVLENGILISGSAQGTLSVDSFQLSNLGLIIGMDWEGVPSFGIAAEIDSANFDSSILVFIDTVNPANSLFAGSVSNLSLLQLADTVLGASAVPAALQPVLGNIGLQGIPLFTLPVATATALANTDLASISAAFQQAGTTIPSNHQGLLLVTATAGQLWFLTDLTQMKHYQLQMGANGIAVSLEPQFYWCESPVTIGAMTEPAGKSVDARIDLDIVTANVEIDLTSGIAAQATLTPITVGSFLSVTGAGGTGGATLSLSTVAQPSNPVAAMQQPHLLISGDLVICDYSQSVYIDLTQTSLQVAINDQFGPAALSLTCSINRQSLGNSSVAGTLNLAVNDTLNLGPLGNVPIDLDVAASLSLGLVNGDPSASFAGSFSFDGTGITIPQTTLTVSATFFTNLGSQVVPLMETAVKDVFTDVGKWLNAVGSGIVTGFQDMESVASVLASQFGQDAQAAASLLRNAGYEVTAIAGAIGSAYNMAAQDVGSLLNAIGYDANDIATALSTVFAWSANEVSNFLSQSLGLADDVVQGALQAAGYAADEIDDACSWLEDTISNWWNSWSW